MKHTPESRHFSGYFDQAIIQSSAVAGSRNYCTSLKDNIGSTNNLQIAKELCNTTDTEWQSKNFARLRTCLQEIPWQTLFNRTVTMKVNQL